MANMANDDPHIIRLKSDFYRDGFNKLLFSLGVMLTAVAFLVIVSAYLIMAEPVPVSFATDSEWRILPPIPVDKPYLSSANLLQWVSETFSTVFNIDFLNYTTKRTEFAQHFTDNGFKKYNDLLNSIAPLNVVQSGKMVVQGVPNGAPVVINQGILANRYAWWVQIPVNVSLTGYSKRYTIELVLQALVVRVPTLNNLSGVAIDNIVVTNQRQINTGTLGA